MRKREWIAVGTSILICQCAGLIGSVFTASAIPTWYAGLTKPVLNPPSWLFGPVWTTLYCLMGVAVFLVWRKGARRSEVRSALRVFATQLVLNAVWSILFFGLHSPAAALVEILALWLSIVLTMRVFYPLSKTAAYLLVPYLGWVSFATYLNYALWHLN